MQGRSLWVLVTLFPLLAGTLSISSAQAPSAEEVMRQASLVQFYSGDDMKARVLMRLITRDGGERIREMTMLRKNLQPGGDQRYFIYFHRPADVRDMTFMVWKYPLKDDDRWLFVPALKLVKRIAANDKRSNFVGSDFSYEDVSGRDPEEDTHRLLREETVGDRGTYVVESTPKDPGSVDFSRRVSWIDKATRLPLREEYYDRRGELMKVFSADERKVVEGLPTIVKRSMENVQSGHRTEVTLQEVRYNLGLKVGLFSERALRQPPAEWIR